MKNYQWLWITVFCFLTVGLTAQFNFGLKAGASLSTSYGSPEKFNGQELESVALRPGYQVGLQTSYGLSEAFTLFGEVNFEHRVGVKQIQVGQTIPTQLGDVIVGVDAELTNKFSYLNVPILAAYNTGNFQVYAGPNFGYLLRTRTDRETVTTVSLPAELPANTPGLPQAGTTNTEIDFINDEAYEENGPYVNRFELGANIGLMYTLPNNLLLDLRLNHGITDITNNDYDRSLIDQSPRSDSDRNVSIQFSVTYWLRN